MHPNAPSTLLTIAKVWKQPKCTLTDEQIKKMWNIYISTHTHTNITQPLKKNEILLFVATWMDRENIILNEISQTEKDKYCMISHMCNLKNTTNYECNKKEADSQI